MEIKEKAMRAAVRYLELKGCHVIYDNFMDENVIVFEDDDVVFADIVVFANDEFKEHAIPRSRESFEDLSWKFFAQEHEPVDVGVRYDIIELHVCAEDRAIIRHCVNAPLKGGVNVCL